MQKLEGEFAEYYNIRKKRKGAFWEGRYWCTMTVKEPPDAYSSFSGQKIAAKPDPGYAQMA